MGPIDSGGPFGSSIGKTFAPTSDAAVQAKQTNPLAGEQQAVKVLRFDLPNVIPETAPSPAALLAPKPQIGGSSASPNSALFASVMRSILGPQADALNVPSLPAAATVTPPADAPSPVEALTPPIATASGAAAPTAAPSPSAPFGPGGGSNEEDLGVDRNNNAPHVGGGPSPQPPVNTSAAPPSTPAPTWYGAASGSGTPGDSNNWFSPPQVATTIQYEQGTAGPFGGGDTAATPMDWKRDQFGGAEP